MGFKNIAMNVAEQIPENTGWFAAIAMGIGILLKNLLPFYQSSSKAALKEVKIKELAERVAKLELENKELRAIHAEYLQLKGVVSVLKRIEEERGQNIIPDL